ncbi:MAG: hypothetical protein AB2693_31500 [Candidatus Thiodiazotropha sp.]
MTKAVEWDVKQQNNNNNNSQQQIRTKDFYTMGSNLLNTLSLVIFPSLKHFNLAGVIY